MSVKPSSILRTPFILLCALLLSGFVLQLTGCPGGPLTEPGPEPVLDSGAEPAPEPLPEAKAEAIPEPKPEPTLPEPGPEPQPEPSVPDVSPAQYCTSRRQDCTAATAKELKGSVKEASLSGCYLVTEDIFIDVDVKVQPGTVFLFKANTSMSSNLGSLQAIGTNDQRICMMGESDTPGHWKGLSLPQNRNATEPNELTYVDIYNTGSAAIGRNEEPAAIAVSAKLKLTNCTIKDGTGYGLYSTGADLTGFASNTFSKHDKGPMLIVANQMKYLDKATQYQAQGEERQYIKVNGGTIGDASTIPAVGFGYNIEKDIRIQAKVELEAGVRMQFAEDTGLFFELRDAGLRAVGTQAEKIFFTGQQNRAGYWKGISLGDNTKNELRYVELSHTGSSALSTSVPLTAIYLGRGELDISNSTIKESKGYGLYLETFAETAITGFASNTFEKLEKAPLSIPAALMGVLDTATQYAEQGDTTEPFVHVRVGKIAKDMTIKAIDVPFHIEENLSINTGEVTVDPGVNFKFAEDTGFFIYSGRIKAVGNDTGQGKILLQGQKSESGYWRGIYIDAKSTRNELTHVELLHTGSNTATSSTQLAALYLNGELKLTNTTIGEGKGHGLVTVTAAAKLPDFKDNEFVALDKAGVSINVAQIGALDTGTVYGSTSAKEPYVEINAYGTSHGLGTNTTIRDVKLPYHIQNGFQISAAEVTIEKNVIMRFAQNQGISVTRDASLTAIGNKAEMITFEGQTATKGFWTGFRFTSNSVKNVFTSVKITHTGANDTPAITLSGGGTLAQGKLTLTDSIITDGTSYGVVMDVDAGFTSFSKNRFERLDKAPLHVTIENLKFLDGETVYAEAGDTTEPFVLVRGGSFTANATIKRLGIGPWASGQSADRVHYRIQGLIQTRAELTIEAGVEMRFEQSAYLWATANPGGTIGSIQIKGTSSLPVKLTGTSQIAGFWQGVRVDSKSVLNNFTYTTVEYGGRAHWFNPSKDKGANVYVGQGASLSLSNCTISHSKGAGILLAPGATLSNTNNTFSNIIGMNVESFTF